MIIPAIVGIGIFEYNLREAEVRANRAHLDEKGTYTETQAVQDLVKGCWAQQKHNWIPSYLAERRFGNCRSLQRAPLNQAKLRDADLRDADLRNADLRAADLRSAIILATDLRSTRGLTRSQLVGENPPLLCHAPLPAGLDIEGGKDRDCDKLPEVLQGRYPGEFVTLADAAAYVEAQRRQVWE